MTVEWGGVRRRVGSAGPIGRDSGPAREALRGAVQGRAPDLTAQKNEESVKRSEERENFARLIKSREQTMAV